MRKVQRRWSTGARTATCPCAVEQIVDSCAFAAGLLWWE